MNSTLRTASLVSLAWLAVAGPLAASPSRLVDRPDPLHPEARAAIRPRLAPRVDRIHGTGAMSQIDPSLFPCTLSIGFDDVTAAPPPGANHDLVLESGSTGFGERFAGQSVGAIGDFDSLGGDPSNPLTLAAGEPGKNLDVLDYLGDRILSPLGPAGFPNFAAVGEGAFAALFDADQSTIAFEIQGADGGLAFLEFFRRDGSRIEAFSLSGITDGRYAFRREGGFTDIAGFSLWHEDEAGLGIDDICHDVRGVPGHRPVCAAGGPYSGVAGQPVSFDGRGSTDAEPGALEYRWDFGDGNTGAGATTTHAYAAAGSYVVGLCVVDADRLTSCCGAPVVITAPKNGAPDCGKAKAMPRVLWPPDHRLVRVSLGGVVDPDGDPVSIVVTGVSQDEPVAGKSRRWDESSADVGGGDPELDHGDDGDDDHDGDHGDHRDHGDRGDNGWKDEKTCPDAKIDARGRLWLRAERDAHGDGRTYTIAYTASDGHGGSCSGTVQVCVPRRRGSKCDGDPPIASSLLSCGRRLESDPAETVEADPDRLDLACSSLAASSVRISYVLPAGGDVSLVVYDLAGRQVAALERGWRNAGKAEVVWNAAGHPRGLYFCRLKLDDQQVVRRLVLR